ncbi:MAG: histidinol dehydrogenase [Chitinophagaceae bacterium]
MKLYRYPEKNDWPALLKRPFRTDDSVEKKVKKILRAVKKEGDKALRRYTRQLDGVKLSTVTVTAAEFRKAASGLEEELKTAILQAKKNIETFHRRQLEEGHKTETMPGVTCWRKPVAIEKVGLYIPGGTAPLFSTILMLAVPATLAGCPEITLCTPPARDGSIHPAILYTANLCGITRVCKAGGAQAIGAMAYGTASVPRVQKIFGPGNQYVTIAKQLVQQEGIAIDMPAGPSELLVIADETAEPAFTAADLLSQAEHGPDSQVMLVTTDPDLITSVNAELEKQLDGLPRKDIAQKALKKSRIILLKSAEEAISFSNSYAPEHLILACRHAAVLAEKVTAAGSVFIGHYSPEAAGDYASGTNHTLPTNGYAAVFSGVSTDSFVKKITFQQLSGEGLKNISVTVMKMAEAEGLAAHRNAVAIRLKK